MKKYLALIGLLMAGALAWRIGERLSADALGMAVGVMMGVLAGVPVALVLLAANRRQGRYAPDEEDDDEEYAPAPQALSRRQRFQPQPSQQHGGYLGQPQQGGYFPQPIIVLAGHPAQGGAPLAADPYGQAGARPHYALPAPQPQTVDARQFKVVGEQEEWIEEW